MYIVDELLRFAECFRLLENHDALSAEELSCLSGATLCQVLGLIDALCYVGLPIEAIHGKGYTVDARKLNSWLSKHSPVIDELEPM